MSTEQKQTTETMISPSRRGLLSLVSAGIGVAVGTQLTRRGGEAKASPDESPKSGSSPQGLDPQRPQGLNLDDFIVHGYTPITLETKRDRIGTSVITHERHLFIRNNLPLPDRSIIAQPDQWELTIKGVHNERKITVAELKTLGLHTVTTVLQCSGNGRQFFEHGPSGSQWGTGAAGCVVWSGVKLSDVIDTLGGVKDGHMFLTSTGGDPIPEGIDPLSVMVERSIPIEKALEDVMLAWEMNGTPLSIEHGGPLRLVVPGYFGCNQIKYIKQIAFTSEQTKAKIQSSGYRMRPIGQKGAPDQPSLWAMPVKSWLTNPETLYGARQVLRGVALGGERAVEKVEVSVDGGTSWRVASFVGPDLGPFAWRLFQLPVELPLGTHTLMTRAFDTQGEGQPETREENERGYRNNGWRDHALTVQVKAETDRPSASSQKIMTSVAPQASPVPLKPAAKKSELTSAAQRGKEVFLNQSAPPCGVCHRLDDAGAQGAIGPHLDELKPTIERIKRAVYEGLGAMPAQRQFSEQQLNDLAQYVYEATQAK